MKARFRSRCIRWLMRLAFFAVALVTLIALVLAVEGYRAKRAWTAYRQELEAKGEVLDWNRLRPPEVPNDRNFLATASLARFFGFEADPAQQATDPGYTNAWREFSGAFRWASYLGFGNWREGTVTDLSEWQIELRSPDPMNNGEALAERYGLTNPQGSPPPDHPANSSPPWAALLARPPGTPLQDLRFLLERHQALLEELRAAAQRPYSQLPLTFEADPEALMDRFARLKSLVYILRASCWTELVAGNPKTAREDFEAMLALGDAAGSQPLLISVLVKMAIVQHTIQTLWAGLGQHRWSDPQLAILGSRLERLNLVDDVRRGMRGERVFALAQLAWGGDESDHGGTAVRDPMRDAMRWWPTAVRYRNRINIARAYQALLVERLDPSGPQVQLRLQSEAAALKQKFSSRSLYNVFTPLLLPAMEKSLENAARGQAAVTLARVACALERHRLVHGQYPSTLDELAPTFLSRIPPDPVNGGTLRYRLDSPSAFVLYSVGLNGKDDGGQVSPRSDSTTSVAGGDWVWRSDPVR